jgi:predicted oxidoreductase
VRHTILGKSHLDVSRIAFGTWQLGGEWGETDTVAATEAIRRAANAGVTIFDTAQGYGFGQSARSGFVRVSKPAFAHWIPTISICTRCIGRILPLHYGKRRRP